MATPRVTLRPITRKKRKVYQLDFSVNGERIREIVGTDKKDAELVRAKVQSDLTLGTYGLKPAKKQISLSELVDGFMKSKKSRIQSTSLTRYKNYYNRFQTYFKAVFPAAASNIHLIQLPYLEEFVGHVIEPENLNDKRWSQSTVNDAIRSIKALFTFAVEQEYMEKSPARLLEAVRERGKGKADYFTDEQLEMIWKKVDAHWIPALKFIAETGLRRGELVNLRWNNVSLKEGQEQITVETTDDFETKTGNSRTIPLTRAAVEILEKQKGKHTSHVFANKEGKPIHPDKIYHAIKTALNDLGLQGDVHKLRHTYASRLALKGVDLLSIKTLMGHTDLKTTQIYAHLSPQHLRDAVRSLESSEDTLHPKGS
jgi:integrase